MIRGSNIGVFAATVSPTLDIPAIDPRYAFRRFDFATLSACNLAREKGRATTFEHRLSENHFAAGFIDPTDGVVSYLWASGPAIGSGQAPFEQGLHIRIPDGAVYIWDCRTDPRHRQRGLYRAGLAELLRWAAGIGAERAYIISDVANDVSSRAILDAGFDALSSMSLNRFGPLVLVTGSHGTSLRRTGSVIGLPNV